MGSHCLFCSVPIQKLILLHWDSKSLASHLHRGWGGEGRGGRRPGVEGKQEEEEAAVEEWHHLSWNVTIISSLSFSCLQRWHHPIGAPPPSVLSIAVWGGSVFICVHVQEGVSEGVQESIVERERERERKTWEDVCLRSFHASYRQKSKNPHRWQFNDSFPRLLLIISHLLMLEKKEFSFRRYVAFIVHTMGKQYNKNNAGKKSERHSFKALLVVLGHLYGLKHSS